MLLILSTPTYKNIQVSLLILPRSLMLDCTNDMTAVIRSRYIPYKLPDDTDTTIE